MDGNTWTKAQKDAIKAKGGSVLVSAAAGSGKTAVLVQRVIEILTDKKNVCEANRLLIVTFTKAAAAEMRERINRRLAELIEQNPGDTFLKRQQILLSSAHISTIHSFCSSLIKDNFYKLDIPKEFRIADSSEIALLREDAINEVFEENYKASRGAFLHLIEIFNNDKNDKKLVEIINSLYDFIRSYPFPKKWLDEKLQMYDSSLPAEKSAFGQIILNYAESLLCYCSDALISAKTLISKEEKLSAYLTSFEQDLSAIQQIKDSLKSESWDDIAEKINNFTMSTLKRITGEHDNPVKLKVLSIRKQIKSTLLELQGLFAEKASDCIDDTKRLFPIVKELFCIVRDFYEKLEELKRKSSICDFGDLEHLSIKLLVSPSQSDFERTEVAKELSEKFKYIMIDECQDINAAQDMIFKAISKDEANLFTVGDVKQSIYRFRQAMPEIFLDRKERYKKYDEKAAEYPAKIILDRNFRSRKEILDMVNFIFRKIMSREIGEMEYTKEEELRLGAVFEDNSQDSTVELKVLDLSTKYDDENLDAAEARYISAQIYKMITQGYKVKDKDGFRAVTFRDFCILLRNTNKHTQIFAKEMLACGIPTIYDNTGGFFSTNEVSVMTSLLNVIDNPVQDVPLISVLLSPIAGFSVDDLAFLRAQSPDLPLYFAFLEYSKINERAKLFLDKLKKWRALAATMRSDKLINYIYADSGYINTVQAMPLGQIRLNNLRLLAEYARNFEANERKGLGSFVVFINRLKEQKFDLNAASSFSKLDNAVRIMSIHKSKGLEFPVCFIANCSRQFNKDKDDVLLHPNFGIGIKLLDKERGFRYNTYQRKAIKIELERAALSEELRVLYVAMTRAKEKLFLITSLKDPAAKLAALAERIINNGVIPPNAVRTSGSFSDWLLLCVLSKRQNDILYASKDDIKDLLSRDLDVCKMDFVDLVAEDGFSGDKNANIQKENFDSTKLGINNVDDNLLNLMKQRFSYTYKMQNLCTIPTKVTVTDIVAGKNNKYLDFSRSPDFSAGNNITPTQLGTAMHTFLQFADFDSARKNLSKEMDRLISKGYLQEELSQKLNWRNIQRFLDSDLVTRILKSTLVKKEYEFSIRMPINEYTGDLSAPYQNENIILQGSIDCAFIEDNEWVIVDYKTDKFKSLDEIKNKYSKQLKLYSMALRKCTCTSVKQTVLYLFHTGEQIVLLE